MYVVTKTAILSNRGGIPRGTILPVHENDGCYVVASGHYFEGVIISPKETEPFWPYQEMIRLSEEASELKKRYEQAVQDRELLQRKIDELTRERKELLETIERAVDEQVVLPKKVSDALDVLLKEFGADGTLELILGCRENSVLDGVNVWERPWYKLRVAMLKEVDLDTILAAIVNGYRSSEQALEEQVSQMLQEWVEAEYEGDEETDRRMFAKRLTEFIKGELAKSG